MFKTDNLQELMFDKNINPLRIFKYIKNGHLFKYNTYKSYIIYIFV